MRDASRREVAAASAARLGARGRAAGGGSARARRARGAAQASDSPWVREVAAPGRPGGRAPVVEQWSHGPPGLAGAGRLCRGLVSGDSVASTVSTDRAGELASLASAGFSIAASASASSSLATAVETPSASTRTRQYQRRLRHTSAGAASSPRRSEGVSSDESSSRKAIATRAQQGAEGWRFRATVTDGVARSGVNTQWNTQC